MPSPASSCTVQRARRSESVGLLTDVDTFGPRHFVKRVASAGLLP